LVLFLALLGRRIEEAVGLQPADLDENNVLYIHRVIYNGHVEMLGEDEVQVLPLDAAVHADLIRRLRGLMSLTPLSSSLIGLCV
jgi:integrase